MFKGVLNMFCFRKNALDMTGSTAAEPGAPLSQSQLVLAGSDTAVCSPVPAKPVVYGSSVQACLRGSTIWVWGKVQEIWKGKQNP